MKKIVTAALMLASFISCNKKSDTSSSINGEWNLITDSVFVGVAQFNHLVVITGQAGDYFDFRTDGKLYTKEGSTYDTSAYHIITDTTLIINSFGLILNGVYDTCHIFNLTAHSAIVHSPVIVTPGGEFGRTVYLSR